MIEPKQVEVMQDTTSPAAWLVEQLAAGAIDSRLVKERADAAGISPKLLRNAREALGVVTARSGNPQTGIASTWALPSLAGLPAIMAKVIDAPSGPLVARRSTMVPARAAPVHPADTTGPAPVLSGAGRLVHPPASSTSATTGAAAGGFEQSRQRRPHRFADHAKSRDIDSLSGEDLRSYAREIGMTRRDVAELGDDRLRAGCKSHLARHFEDLTS